MNIFSEIYGAYFRIAGKTLKNKTVTAKEINNFIEEEGFADSVLFLPQKLLPQKDGSDWGLLNKNDDGTFSRVTKKAPVFAVTNLQKRWLKTKLSDPKTSLFLSDTEIEKLSAILSEIKPLFTAEQYRYTDKFSDGDSFEDESYRRNFHEVLEALKYRTILDISFWGRYQNRISGQYVPVKIQYSEKNDKFRLYCYEVKTGKHYGSTIINIGRIEKAENTGESYNGEISAERLFAERRCSEPALLRVTPERNAVERFMNEFSAYEKQSERDLETGICTVKLWYDKFDETELLIRLLSFGPVLEILGPPDFRKQAADRVMRQAELLNI